MSFLHFLNWYVLQWFFIRLCKIINTNTNKIIKWNLIIGVFPLSGWGDKPYKNTGKRKKIKYLF